MIYRVTKVSESTRSSSRGSKKCITVAISPRTNEIPLRNILCRAETRTPINRLENHRAPVSIEKKV